MNRLRVLGRVVPLRGEPVEDVRRDPQAPPGVEQPLVPQLARPGVRLVDAQDVLGDAARDPQVGERDEPAADRPARRAALHVRREHLRVVTHPVEPDDEQRRRPDQAEQVQPAGPGDRRVRPVDRVHVDATRAGGHHVPITDRMYAAAPRLSTSATITTASSAVTACARPSGERSTGPGPGIGRPGMGGQAMRTPCEMRWTCGALSPETPRDDHKRVIGFRTLPHRRHGVPMTFAVTHARRRGGEPPRQWDCRRCALESPGEVPGWRT